MGTEVHVVVHGPVELAEVAREQIELLESLWSRFRDTSEVSELNRRAGSWVQVSPPTLDLVARAIQGWQVTEGRFDPTVLGDVIRSGYDRSFDELRDVADRDGRIDPVDLTDPTRSHLHRFAGGIMIDREAGAVRIPAGVGFDPGGIGKGLAADLVAEHISFEGAAGVVVNIGGDLRALGIGPAGDDWTIDVDPAHTGVPLTRVALEQGGLATSTVLRRRWQVGDESRHHLIDPSTGRPTDHGVVSATVLAGQAWQAEVLAKVALTRPIADGLEAIAAREADALLVDAFGGLHPTPGFARFTAEPAHTGGS